MERYCVILVCALGVGDAVMLSQRCPRNEMFVACSFIDEHVCWRNEQKRYRVMVVPQRLLHCKSSCFCKKSHVRAYPGGECIPATTCRDLRLVRVIKSLPTAFPGFYNN